MNRDKFNKDGNYIKNWDDNARKRKHTQPQR